MEHQSKQDPLMPLRLHKYMHRIWDSYQMPFEKKDPRPLPVIVPLVFYTGVSPYTGPRTIWDLCGEQSDLMKKILIEPFPLVDLNRIPGKMLIEYNFAGLMEFVMRQEFKMFIGAEESCSEKLKEELRDLAQGFEKLSIEGNDPFLLQLAQYVMVIANMRYTVNDLSKLIQNALPPKIGGEIMGLAEKFKREGFSDPSIVVEITDLPLDQVQEIHSMACS